MDPPKFPASVEWLNKKLFGSRNSKHLSLCLYTFPFNCDDADSNDDDDDDDIDSNRDLWWKRNWNTGAPYNEDCHCHYSPACREPPAIECIMASPPKLCKMLNELIIGIIEW